MNIKSDLIKNRVLEEISLHFNEFEIDTSEITDTDAIKALSEIQEILNSGEDDFMIVENIMAAFDKYNFLIRTATIFNLLYINIDRIYGMCYTIIVINTKL